MGKHDNGVDMNMVQKVGSWVGIALFIWIILMVAIALTYGVMSLVF